MGFFIPERSGKNLSTTIDLSLALLISIPAILNWPHIKDKLQTAAKGLKASSRKKINKSLTELTYLYDNTSSKKHLFNFRISNNKSEKIKIKVYNAKFIYLQFESSHIIPFSLIRIKENAVPDKHKIEKYFKIKEIT